jgi:hypothetical protein
MTIFLLLGNYLALAILLLFPSVKLLEWVDSNKPPPLLYSLIRGIILVLYSPLFLIVKVEEIVSYRIVRRI